MSLMVKTVFESDTSLRNYREKMKKLDWMCACVSLRQRVSGGIASSRKGFYASTN
jgi:hypothetical protein